MSLFSKFACVLLLTSGHIFPVALAAQSNQSSSSSSGAVATLNEQQKAGKGLFMQNCSVCHLPILENSKDAASGGPTIGPLLEGLFRGERPRPEEAVRTFIMRGTPKMPGFQYGLERSEIDSIIAYLKTL